ncbi:MAG: YfhO family protein [Thermodesulfobacteriota bacterium]
MALFTNKGIDSLRKSSLSPFLFFIIILIFFYDLLKDRFILTERDLAPYFIPPRFFWVESIKRGDFPLWNPYQFSGHPFFANPQHAILYPINGLFFLLPFDIAFNAIILIHFFLGGFFTYLFLMDLEASPTNAFISGLIFMLSGYLLSVHSLLTVLLSVVWTPLIMMFFRRAMNNPGIKNEILTAVFMTVSFLGGGVEIVYGNFFVLLFMLIFQPFVNPPILPFSKGGNKEGLRAILTRLKILIVISIVFLILSAIQLLPFLELWIHSIRSQGISYQEATVWSFAPKDLLLFFLPDAYGYFLDMKKYWLSQCWLKTLYTGGLPFILSIIYFIKGKERRLFLSLMVFSIFLSLGHYNPFYELVFKYVPFFNGIRYPVKFLYIFIFGLAITAGLGLDRLKTVSFSGKENKLKYLLTAFSLFSAFLLLILIFGDQEISSTLKEKGIDFPAYNHISTNLYHIKRFFFYLTIFFLLLRIGYEVRWKPWVNILLIFFLTADLFGNMGFYGKERTSDYFRKTKILEMISSDREAFRIFSTPKTISMDTPIFIPDPTPLNVIKEKHLPTLNLLHSFRDVWGIDVIRLKRIDNLYRTLTEAPSISSTPLMELFGVKYVISVTPIEDPRLELVYSLTEGLPGKKEDLLKENTIKLYKNRIPPERVWFVKKFKVMDSESILKKVKNHEVRVIEEVLLEEEPGPFLSSNTQHKPKPLPSIDKIEWISESNHRTKLSVHASENSILVFNDTYFPGWKAFIDGKREKIFRADYNFRALPVSSGSHQVEFVYDPLSFKLGAWITLLGIMGCLSIGIFRRRR